MEVKKEDMLTKEDMLKMLEEERLERERVASGEINVILKRYNCEMNAVVTFGPSGKVGTQINITAKRA